MIVCDFSFSSDAMRLLGPVDAEDKLSRHEVAQVLHAVGRGVDVVVAAFSVMAEAVGVLHAQIQTLDVQQRHKQITVSSNKKKNLKRYLVCYPYVQGLWIQAQTGRSAAH